MGMHDTRSDPAVRARLLAQLIPAVVAVACYVGALANGFAYDDVVIVRDNYTIHSLATIPFALRIPYWYTTGHLYRPLTTLLFALEWIPSHGSPAVFHAVNIAWHAMASALVARLVLRCWPGGRATRAPTVGGDPVAAAVAGCIFAIHPVHVEAVANVVGASELMCAVALLGLALVVLESPRAASTTPSRERLLAIGVLAAAATASKEVGVVAPIVAWAAAWLAAHNAESHEPGTRALAWRWTWPITVAAAAGVAFLLAVRVLILDALAGDKPHAAFLAATPWQATALALASLPRAVGLMLVPQLPRPDYSPTDAALAYPNAILVILGGALVVAGIAVIVAHARRPTPWTFAAVFTVATLAPVSNLIVRTGVVVAERTLYSPSVGVALVYGAALAIAWQTRRWLIMGLAGALAAVALVFTITTVPIWHDSPAVFAAMRVRAPESYKTYSLSAAEQEATNNPAAAHRYYMQSLALFSHDPTVLQDAAANALTLRDTTDALNWYDRALAVDSTTLRARTALAALLIHRGDTTRARVLLEDGLRRSPNQRTWRQMLVSIGG